MKNFTHYTADTHANAAKALAAMPAGVAKAGGTDLLDVLKERIVEPDALVQLPRGAAGAAGTLAAGATLAELAADPTLAQSAPAVQQAAAAAATPQIRNVGTLGGNLAQYTRCWYFRDRSFDCYKRGNGACAMLVPGADSRYGAITGHAKCGCAHPSNLAPALIAVGATVHTTHPDGPRALPAEALYRPPKRGALGDTVLRPGELITHVTIPAAPVATHSVYLEMRERQSFDFAVVAVAAGLHVEGGTVQAARIAFGAVAPIPVRAVESEAALAGKPLNADTIGAAVAAALPGAAPLEQNGFKPAIARRLLRQALESLA